MTFQWHDKVQINHPEVSGTGIITRFHNDKFDGVEIEIIEAVRPRDGKKAKPGRKFNCLQKHLAFIERRKSTLHIEDDTLMAELFESEERREEAIPVITPEFVGKWK